MAKAKKVKLKTHKGLKKVLNVRNSGTITMGRPGSRHNTGKKSSAVNRKNRKGSQLSTADRNRLQNIIK